MKKKLLMLSLLCFIIMSYFIIFPSEKYRITTNFKNEKEGYPTYISKTDDFLTEVNKTSLKDNVIKSNKYGVTMSLNQFQLNKLLENEKISQYIEKYTPYDEVPTKGSPEIPKLTM